MKTTAFALAAAIVSAPALALGASIGGEPITTQNAADISEMTRIADAIDAAVDAKDWK